MGEARVSAVVQMLDSTALGTGGIIELPVMIAGPLATSSWGRQIVKEDV